MPSHKDNPYANAANKYDGHARAHTDNQRELEARILLKANRMFQSIIEKWDTNLDLNELEEALKYNRQIWVLFYDTAIENKDGGRPNDLRSNIVNLANFIFKREMEILADPQKQKLDVLININREISAGLMTNPVGAQEQPAAPVNPDTHKSTDISG